MQEVEPPKPKGQVPPTDMRSTAPTSYKTQGLKVSDKGRARMQKTLDARAAKQAKFDSPPSSGPERDKVLKEKSKDTQSRFQKFLKEFKSVFKNTGKAIKPAGMGPSTSAAAVTMSPRSPVGSVPGPRSWRPSLICI